MDPEIKELLEKNLALNEENNRLLRGLRRSNRIGFIWKVVYLGVFLGGAAIAFQYVEPYYRQAMDAYKTTVETQTKISEGINKYLPR